MRWFKFQEAPPVAELAELSCPRNSSSFTIGWLRPAVMLAIAGLLSTSWVSPTFARSDGDRELDHGRIPSMLFAVRPPYLFTHNVGLLTLQVTNVGIIGNPFIDDFRAGWRGGEYLYDSSLWVGAIGSDSEVHVSLSRYRQAYEFRPDADARWTIYESFEGLKGGVRLGSFDIEAADDDHDGLFDEDFHNGLDDDGDGLVDEDYAAIGQQMFSCMYRDDTPEALVQEAEHYPLNILVRQRSFQWSTAGINEFVGFDFEIVNTGSQRLKELYIGFFSDSDAGPRANEAYYSDDLVGWAHIDTTVVDQRVAGECGKIDLEMDAAFIWDAPDNGTDVAGGDVPGVFGTLFLGHTTDDTGIRAPQNVGLHSVAWFSSSGENSDPRDDFERYELLSSGTKPRRSARQPDDYRYVISAGSFAQLNPGESLNFQTAYVIGDGQDGFRANAVNAQRVFNGRYVDADRNDQTGIDGKERCLQALGIGTEVIWDDPCDTLMTEERFRRTPPCDVPGPHYVDADCNSCTGVDGKEALVSWVGTTAPPPPTANTDPEFRQPGLSVYSDPAGDRAVILQWDNASELSSDPITGEDVFRGYRVWRADNWQRPEGSIGPDPADWMKIAEFRNDISEANSHGAKSLSRPPPEGPLVRHVQPVGFTEDNRPIYPIGRYQFEDTNGLINGRLYFYAVTSFGLTRIPNDVTGEMDEVELAGLPSAVEAEAVIPRWDASGGCEGVKVVPNPYRGGADWDLVPSETDPTGTKIAFRDLPADVSTIRIYTLAGDLVQEAIHDGRSGNGTYFWNLITRNGQNITSGIYLFSVQHGGEVCRGRFVVLR